MLTPTYNRTQPSSSSTWEVCPAASEIGQVASAATLTAAQVKRECSRRQKVIDSACPQPLWRQTLGQPDRSTPIGSCSAKIFCIDWRRAVGHPCLAGRRSALWRSASRTRRPRNRSAALRPKEKAALRGGPVSRLKSARLRSLLLSGPSSSVGTPRTRARQTQASSSPRSTAPEPVGC
jgi:hypothetical protein